MTPRLEKRHADGVQSCTALAYLKAARPRRSQISDVGGKGMPAIPRRQENEGVGEHVRTRFHASPKAACEIAELLFGGPHRTKKTRFFCRTAKENGPTVDLMSRRHPLSSTRTL